jgi:PKD repeat protein
MWDFTGDLVPDSLDQNPSYVFETIGNYSVNLTVRTFAGKVYSLTIPDYIKVTNTPGSDGWISSDQYLDGQDATGSGQIAIRPAQTSTASSAAQGTQDYSPLGTKIAAALLDIIIVVGVIGAGVIIWRKK